jgi:DNA-directed RNA polymerase specialized sigma24 family protein
MVETMSNHIFRRSDAATRSIQNTSEVFDEWFSRCLGPLHFIACRVLKGPEEADVAVQKCWLIASRNPRTFDVEGDFRSWLLRVLIDEASAILLDRLHSQMRLEYAQQ